MADVYYTTRSNVKRTWFTWLACYCRALRVVLQHGRSVLDANIPHEFVTLNCLMTSHVSRSAVTWTPRPERIAPPTRCPWNAGTMVTTASSLPKRNTGSCAKTAGLIQRERRKPKFLEPHNACSSVPLVFGTPKSIRQWNGVPARKMRIGARCTAK